jgi:hypothetical protein
MRIVSYVEEEAKPFTTCLKCLKITHYNSSNEIDIYNIPPCENCIQIKIEERDKKINDILNEVV